MNSADIAEKMNASTLLFYVVFPAIFLIVGSLNTRHMAIKVVCIVLAYFSLILGDGSAMHAPAVWNGVVINKDTSPFGLVCLAISLWGFVLVGSGAGKAEEEDNG